MEERDKLERLINIWEKRAEDLNMQINQYRGSKNILIGVIAGLLNCVHDLRLLLRMEGEQNNDKDLQDR